MLQSNKGEAKYKKAKMFSGNRAWTCSTSKNRRDTYLLIGDRNKSWHMVDCHIIGVKLTDIFL